MLEGVSPLFLRVSKLLLLSFFFVVCLFTFDYASAGNIPVIVDTPTPGGNLLPDPFAGASPGMTPAPNLPPVLTLPDGTLINGLPPSSPNSPDGGGGGQDANPAPSTQTGETPVTQVVSDCSEGFFASLNCFVINFFGSFVAIAGLTFDTAVGLFIIQFGDQYLNTNLGWTIERLWTTVRDIFNLLFIFGLVYIGFQIILGTNESQAKRTIPLLIIAGLLVNFSLFIVKFIVDFANLAAYQIYTLFSAIGANQAPATAVSNLGGLPSISTAFLNSLGVGQILSVVAVNQEFLYLIGLLVIFAVLIYVFFMGAILITIRFAVLLMYIVFSPAMFLGWVFPGMQGITDKYWRGLLGQAFFAPALLFMLYLSYRVIDGYNAAMRSSLYEINNGLVNSGANTDNAEAVVNQEQLVGAFVDVMPFFVMVVVFLIASMVVARKMADSGGSMVMKINNYGIGKLNGALRGTGAFAGGVAAGAGGYMAYKGIDKAANSNNAASRFVGRTLTFTGARDKAEKSFKGSPLGEWKENRKKQSSALAVRKSDSDLASLISRTPKSSEDQIKFEQGITDATSSQIIDQLKEHKPGSEAYQRIVGALSPSQVSKILEAKDDEFSPAKKAEFAQARALTVENRLTSAPIGSSEKDKKEFYSKNPDVSVRFKKAIEKDASADDLKQLGLAKLRDNAEYITAAKMDDLKSKLSPTEWGVLNSERRRKLISNFETDPYSVFKTVDGKYKKDVEIAKLPADILTHKNATTSLSTKVLEVILRENLLNNDDRAKIRDNVTKADGGGDGRVNKMKAFLNESPIGQMF